jgi:hypothetical protein
MLSVGQFKPVLGKLKEVDSEGTFSANGPKGRPHDLYLHAQF